MIPSFFSVICFFFFIFIFMFFLLLQGDFKLNSCEHDIWLQYILLPNHNNYTERIRRQPNFMAGWPRALLFCSSASWTGLWSPHLQLNSIADSNQYDDNNNIFYHYHWNPIVTADFGEPYRNRTGRRIFLFSFLASINFSLVLALC
ncbi:hypothetical protein V8F44DRAFT_17647 [Aspergillus fumigatus]